MVEPGIKGAEGTVNEILESTSASGSTSNTYLPSNTNRSTSNDCNTNNKSTSSNIGKSSPAGRRLHKELMKLATDPPDGITIDPQTLEGKDLSTWKVLMSGPSGTLFDGEDFSLQFKFGPKYPFDSPEVIFVGNDIPEHPHIYSNGHICLSILTEDWSPALSVQAVCISIISMLASCKEKKRPPDNSFYVKTCHKNPKKTRWWYHDDTV